MRSSLCVFIALVVSAALHTAAAEKRRSNLSERLIQYYKAPAHYRAVKRDVLRWHKTTRNGCVAFASTALRHVGFDIPEDGKLDGWGVSRITFSFSDYLVDAGWSKIEDAGNLLPGDMVFTTGYPDHVFVFHSWKSADEQLATVIDNQGFMSRRRMTPLPGSGSAAFAYALRGN